MFDKPQERRDERSQQKDKGRAVSRCRADEVGMKPTDIAAPDYFHKVVDCQWACPAHTPVPEYIRLIAEGRYSDAYMINWRSNVFPGILGRTCDRPCEPACRRGRVEETPVAICRLKRVAADFKDDVKHRMPRPLAKNGKRIAIIGGGGATADDRDALAVFRQRARHAVLDVVLEVGGDALQPADRDRRLLDAAAAAGRLAGAIAGASENSRKHVRPPIDHVGVAIAAFGDQADVLGNWRMRGTGPLAVDDFMEVIGCRDISRFHSYLVRTATRNRAAFIFLL